MIHHHPVSSFLAALAVTSVMFSGCTAAPQPSPTPTAAFASEEEAFAAAEETYRAYIEALNAVDIADSASLERVYSLLDESAAASTRKSFSELRADGLRVTGPTKYDSFVGATTDPRKGHVSANVCLDVSNVEVLDATGTSVVSPNRPDHQPMSIGFEAQDGTGSLRITSLQSAEEYPCEA